MQITDLLTRLERIEHAINAGIGSRWLTMKKACDYADVSPNTLRKWLDKGLIYGTRTTGDWRIDRQSIDDYFNLDRVV